MLLARVEGNITATRKHPSFQGWRLILCQPISAAGQPEGTPIIAIDAHGAGLHLQPAERGDLVRLHVRPVGEALAVAVILEAADVAVDGVEVDDEGGGVEVGVHAEPG